MSTVNVLRISELLVFYFQVGFSQVATVELRWGDFNSIFVVPGIYKFLNRRFELYIQETTAKCLFIYLYLYYV